MQNAQLEAATADLVQLDGQVKLQQALGALEDAVQRPIDTPEAVRRSNSSPSATKEINREKNHFVHHHRSRARRRRRLAENPPAAPAGRPRKSRRRGGSAGTHITHDTNGNAVINMNDDTQGDVGIVGRES